MLLSTLNGHVTANISADADFRWIAETATGDIQLNASAGKISAAGLNVALDAQIELKASGNAKASIQASGECSIQGALVRIN